MVVTVVESIVVVVPVTCKLPLITTNPPVPGVDGSIVIVAEALEMMSPATLILPAVSVPAVAVPLTDNEDNVPKDVSDEAVTPAAKVEPDNVFAAAVTVIFAEPSKPTPLIVRVLSKVVAVDALPVNVPVNPCDAPNGAP